MKLLPILLVALLVLAILGSPGYHSARSLQALWNLGHILLFFVLFLCLRIFLPGKIKSSFLKVAITGIISTVFLSVIIEFIQFTFKNGTADVWDVYRNFIGLFGGIVFLSQMNIKKQTVWTLRSVFILLLIVELIPVGQAVADEVIARREFPVLADFESGLEKTRWSGGAEYQFENNMSISGKNALKIRFLTTKYSGVSLNYFPGNWTGYDSLKYHIFNPADENLRITCRIHDKQHNNAYRDRYNKRFILYRGWNEISIALSDIKNAPADREMDMKHIMNVAIFTTELDTPRVAYLDYVRLE